jgi:hypothetical protein
MVEWWLEESGAAPTWWPHTPRDLAPSALHIGRAIKALKADDGTDLAPALSARLAWFWSWLYFGENWHDGIAARDDLPSTAEVMTERDQWGHALRSLSASVPELDPVLDEARAHLDAAVRMYPTPGGEEAA